MPMGYENNPADGYASILDFKTSWRENERNAEYR